MPKNEIISPILNEQILRLPLYITQICLDFPQNHSTYRLEGFEDYQLAICVSGSGVFECGGMKHEINEQDAFLFAPHVPHSYYATGSEPWILDWVCYNGQNFEPLYQNGFCVLRQIRTSKTASGIGQIYSLLKENNILNHLEASKELYALLMELTAYRYGFYRNNSTLLKLEPVITYMEQHFERDLSLEELAARIEVSISYLCRIFKAAYRMSPLQYLIHLRINHAKRLMLTFPKMPIKEIASRCGYKDVSYFGAEFKRSTGFSPTIYRSRVI